MEKTLSTLSPKTRELIEVIFSQDRRDDALSSFNLNLKKLPLGVPSQQQIQNGISILNKIKDKLNGDSVSETYALLLSQFCTAIPHSFGCRRPPAISSQDSLQDRYDMCNILLDMFDTNKTIRKIKTNTSKKKVLHPADSHYDSLKANLSLVDIKSQEFKIVKKYFDEIKNSSYSPQLLDVWNVDREGESQRYKKLDNVENKCLLWHDTNIAVVAPILTSGLCMMPHSGVRVGAGIFLASMQEKCTQYTSSQLWCQICMYVSL